MSHKVVVYKVAPFSSHALRIMLMLFFLRIMSFTKWLFLELFCKYVQLLKAVFLKNQLLSNCISVVLVANCGPFCLSVLSVC